MRVRSALELPPHLRAQVEHAAGPQPKRPSKYGNQVVESGGKTFGSKWELKRYNELLEEQSAGIITELRHHVEFPLSVICRLGQPIRICAYEADFAYQRLGQLVVEDTKSAATRRKEAYRIKAKMFEALYGVKLLEVVRAPRNRRNREVTA